MAPQTELRPVVVEPGQRARLDLSEPEVYAKVLVRLTRAMALRTQMRGMPDSDRRAAADELFASYVDLMTLATTCEPEKNTRFLAWDMMVETQWDHPCSATEEIDDDVREWMGLGQ